MSSYYQRFQLVTHSFFWPHLLSWFYKKGLDDAAQLGVETDFKKEDFTCLLSGVSGEVTADIFITFVLSKNKEAKIVIIDMGKEQIDSIKSLVKRKYSNYDITIQQMNVLDISKHFQPQSFDWIETDGLIEYLDKPGLISLLEQWREVLKPEGFITTRDFASNSLPGRLVDKFRIWFMKNYFTLSGYIHTRQELENIYKQCGFSFNSGATPVPTFRRFALAADSS